MNRALNESGTYSLIQSGTKNVLIESGKVPEIVLSLDSLAIQGPIREKSLNFFSVLLEIPRFLCDILADQ
jgi:hypothetical protein